MPFGLGCPQVAPLNASLEACVWSTDPAVYRQLQEVAYVNYEGASALSVVALTLIYPLTVMLNSYVPGVAAMVTTWIPWSPLYRVILVTGEFATAMVPLTCGFCSPHLWWRSLIMHLGVMTGLAALSKPLLAWPREISRLLASRAARRAGTASSEFSCIDERGERMRFVAEYRAVIMISTCLCILAVDFPALFSRTHAKTEEFGYSLMDLGTGSILIATAVCSRKARGGSSKSVMQQAASIRPILLLGFIRFVVLWGIDYHVPTSEYGVHWNFFFTIAVISFVSAVADLGSQASAIAGLSILVAYQSFLSFFGGGEYILHAPRVGPFSANREGILSCAGFLGIHWLGVAIGAEIRSARPARSRAKRLLAIAAGSLACCTGLTALGIPTSRRMCNLPYAIFVIGVNAMVLGLLAMIDLEWPKPRPPLPSVYGGIQDSMFAAFLFANLLTGAVNLLFQPLLIPAGAALVIMLLYTLALTLPFAILRNNNVVLKFW